MINLKFTEKELWDLWYEDPIRIIRYMMDGSFYTNKSFSDIPFTMKRSLCRKAMRYIVEMSHKGSYEATKLAYEAGYCEMELGYPKPLIDDLDHYVFTDCNGVSTKVDFEGSKVIFTNYLGSKTIDKPEGCHRTYTHRMVDITSLYNENPITRNNND